MSNAFITHLADRGVVAVTGADAVKFLNGMVTNEVAQLQAGEAAHAGLLSPQGKILFDFHCVRVADGWLLDVAADKTGDLVKRLSLYKLRAAVEIKNVPDAFAVLALWGSNLNSPGETTGTQSFTDPRHTALGMRILADRRFAIDIASATNGMNADAKDYHAHRIALGVPEGGKDYEFGDAYPHEADFDLFDGVSFKKGCYVGQEVVSRMQHKTVVRKRVVRVEGERDLTSGSDITHNGVVFGRVGSTDGRHALALLKLDRYAEALAAGDTVVAGDVPMRVHDADLQRYSSSVEARAKQL
jgi:folate-binding protein YgfZ